MLNPKKEIKKMKKFILSLGLIAMAFGLTNCTKNEEVNPVVETKGDFAIYATVTRTANDGINTVWSAKDEINVFHAVGETTDYVNDTPYTNDVAYPFVCEDATAGRFLGSLAETLDPQEEYDWYAFYPYSSYIKTPANNSNGYTYVGSKAGSAQVQNGNNSMAHIAGSYCPMAGYAVAVSGDSAPHLTFNHLSSLIEFEITNKLAEAITVSEIQFIAEEDIVGSYYINFASKAALNFTPSGANYVSNTAILTVNDGEEIAAGASAKFYAAVKPFVAATGTDLTIKVSASSASGLGVHEKDITLTGDVTFSAGKIKNVKVNYSTVIEAAEAETWQLITSVDEITTGTYVIVAKQKGGAAIAYCPSTTSTSAGPNQVVTTLFDLQTPAFQSNAVPENARWTFTGDASGLTITNATGNHLYTTASNNGLRVGATSDSWAITAAENGAFNLKDTANSRVLTLYGTSNWRCYTSPYAYGNSDQNSECYLYKLNDGVVVLTPSLTVTPETIEVNAEACTAVIEYTVSNSVDGVEATATPSANWITITNGSNSFNLDIAENNDSATREAKITVSYEGAVSKTVVVKQAGAIAEGSVVILHEEFDNSTTADSSTAFTSTKFPNFSGATSKAYTSKYGGLKLGTGSEAGYITSKALDLSKPFIVEIDACKYGSDTGNIKITVEGVEKSIANSDLGAAGTFKTFTLEFDAATATSTIKIATSAKRAYIDNVKVYCKDSGESGGGEEPVEPEKLTMSDLTTSETSNSITVSWAAVSGAQSYAVSLYDGATTTTTTVTSPTTYTFEGLTASTSYTVSVVAKGDGVNYTDSDAKEKTVKTLAEQTGGGETPSEPVKATATLSFADKAQRTSYSTSQQVWTQNGITFTNDKASSSNNVADYAKPARLYANSKVTVEAPGNITEIVFDCNNSSYATAMKNSIENYYIGSATASSDKVTVTLDGTSTTFVVTKLEAQVRIDAVTVTYKN